MTHQEVVTDLPANIIHSFVNHEWMSRKVNFCKKSQKCLESAVSLPLPAQVLKATPVAEKKHCRGMTYKCMAESAQI